MKPIVVAQIIILVVFCQACTGQTSPSGAQQAADVSKRCVHVASKYKIESVNHRKAVLYPQAVLRWSKHTYENVYGNVHLWTVDKIPVAVASVYQFTGAKTDLDVEFQSLSQHPMKVGIGKQFVWQPNKAGITFQELQESPKAEVHQRIRLIQLRKVARQFKATRHPDKRGVRLELRLLSKEIYSYENKSQGVLAGAIFAFVDQTDPEVLLIVEAVQTGDVASLRFALARFNTSRLTAEYGGKEVFRVEAVDHSTWSDQKGTYRIIQGVQDDPAFGWSDLK